MVRDREKKAELTEHLAELRGRILRSVFYIVAATVVTWFFYDQLFALLVRPMSDALRDFEFGFQLLSFQEAFIVRLQICVVAGLILSSPLVAREVWGFIAPGLTPSERRPIKWIAPLAVLLFWGGVVLCYAILPAAFKWFASYVPEGVELRPTLQMAVLFSLKMLLMFGITFQLPIVLMLLAKIGIVDSKMLWSNWRVAMVGVAILAAVATPSNDAFTMLMMAVPVALLYFFSIFLVKIVEGGIKFPRLFGRRRRNK